MPGKSHGQRSLAGYSRWGLKELDITKQPTHTNIILLVAPAKPPGAVLASPHSLPTHSHKLTIQWSSVSALHRSSLSSVSPPLHPHGHCSVQVSWWKGPCTALPGLLASVHPPFMPPPSTQYLLHSLFPNRYGHLPSGHDGRVNPSSSLTSSCGYYWCEQQQQTSSESKYLWNMMDLNKTGQVSLLIPGILQCADTEMEIVFSFAKCIDRRSSPHRASPRASFPAHRPAE